MDYAYTLTFEESNNLLTVYVEGDYSLAGSFDAIDKVYNYCKNCCCDKILVITMLRRDFAEDQINNSVEYGLELFSKIQSKIAIVDYNESYRRSQYFNKLIEETTELPIRMFNQIEDALNYLEKDENSHLSISDNEY